MYSSDMTLPGMLHAKILRSPHAHARIRRIDTSRAAALPGVHAILSPRTRAGWHTLLVHDPAARLPRGDRLRGPGGGGWSRPRRSDLARQALELIEVEYEVLPAVLDPREALQPDAPRVPALDVEEPREGNVQQPVYSRAARRRRTRPRRGRRGDREPLHPAHAVPRGHPDALLHRRLGRRAADGLRVLAGRVERQARARQVARSAGGRASASSCSTWAAASARRPAPSAWCTTRRSSRCWRAGPVQARAHPAPRSS